MVFVRALVPNLQLVLTSDDTTENPDFLSVALDRTVLQNYLQRMFWIKGVAKKYHGLMQGAYKQKMQESLATIAQWGDLPDE
jgi:DNA repair ATPase RecN